MSNKPSPAAVEGWNAGVESVLAVARRSAQRIASTDKRLAAGFAVEALLELADVGQALLLPTGGDPAATVGAGAETSLSGTAEAA